MAARTRLKRARNTLGALLLVLGIGMIVLSNIREASRQNTEQARRADIARQLAGTSGDTIPADTILGRLAKDLVRRDDGMLRTASFEPDAPPAPYAWFEPTKDHPGGYAYCSRHFVDGIEGFNAPIILGVWLRPDGILAGLMIVEHEETPKYMRMTDAWRTRLIGLRLFEPHATDGEDVVSGATYTSRAILLTLAESASRLRRALAEESPSDMTSVPPPAPELTRPPESETPSRPSHGPVVVAVMMLISVAMHLRPNRVRRRIFLLLLAVVCGFVLNQQISTYQLLSLAGGGFAPAWSLDFLLLAAFLLLLACAGNLYCGYACPFGALQELLAEAAPRWLQYEPPPSAYTVARSLKYLLLFALIADFALRRSFDTTSLDPLVQAFLLPRDLTGFVIVLLLVGSTVVRRGWCRVLCPTGAALSFFNRLRLLRGTLPYIRPADCDLGVRTARDLDCIRCDRCRDGSRD